MSSAMTADSAVRTVAGFSGRPLNPKQLGREIFRAARETVGDVGIAITVRDGEQGGRVIAIVEADGNERLPLSLDLCMGQGSPVELTEPPENQWTPTARLGCRGDQTLAAVLNSYARVIRIPWPISMHFQYDLLLLSKSGNVPDLPLSDKQQLQLNLIATIQLRRAENAELAQARAWIDKEIAEIARLQSALRPDSLEQIRGASFAVHA